MDERQSRDPRRAGPIVDARPFERAGRELARVLEIVLGNEDHARLAIPGGTALEAVCRARQRLGESWGRIRLTWTDERCVPLAHADSNRGAAARCGLLAGGSGNAAGPDRVLPLYEDGEKPAEALQRARLGWKADFAESLDVLCLGMGADGHVASLFPGSPSMPLEGWVGHVADSPKPPADRITLTRASLATAQHVILVAAGETKRDAMRRLLSGDPELPAQGLTGVVIVTDVDPGVRA